MQAEDLEFEKLYVAKAIGLTRHRLDLVVGALSGSSGNGKVVVIEDSLSMQRQCLGDVL